MGNVKKYDFSGWATKANIRCSDGRVIMKGAFKDNDGERVPLVWNHQHNEPENVLGHAILENRDEGVYAYCTFNDSENGELAKVLVQHGDISALSIYANQLIEKGPNVTHGCIKEVSLVIGGANPGASINNVIKHGDLTNEAIIFTGENFDLYHSDENNETAGEDTSTHTNDDTSQGQETLADIVASLNEKQRNTLYNIVGQALENGSENNDEAEEGGDNHMEHNIFEQNGQKSGNVISHSDMTAIINDARRYGSMKESAIAHGIEKIDYLFPDSKTITDTPLFIQRDMGWVSKVMGSVHHSPFARIKSIFANITEEDARAKGYIKGTLKKEEVFTLLKRTTDPTTVYKKQKLDRDDVTDITDFDSIAWVKTEMRMMLNEELARAYLVGDGRSSSSDDKINEMNIRPIWKDEDLFTIKAKITGTTGEERAKAFIKAAIKARKDYKGSGNPVAYMTEELLTDCLLLTDSTGRDLYEDEVKLAKKLRVSEIVPVPVMEGLTRNDDTGTTLSLMGIIVNLQDYNVGADKGGEVNMFDDFDIDYNAQKYLIETRCSGALTKPYSAIAIECVETAQAAG